MRLLASAASLQAPAVVWVPCYFDHVIDASRQCVNDVVLGQCLGLPCLHSCRSAVTPFRGFAQRALELHVVEFEKFRESLGKFARMGQHGRVELGMVVFVAPAVEDIHEVDVGVVLLLDCGSHGVRGGVLCDVGIFLRNAATLC